MSSKFTISEYESVAENDIVGISRFRALLRDLFSELEALEQVLTYPILPVLGRSTR